MALSAMWITCQKKFDSFLVIYYAKTSKNMELNILKKLGFSDKQIKVYLELLRLGPSSVRKLAEITGLNRGTIYEVLKDLQEKQVINYYNKDTKQYFVAEDPEKLQDLVARESVAISEVAKKLDDFIPELKSLYNKDGERPVARYFEKSEIKKILEEVLEICESIDEKEYRIYSAAGIREYLYQDFETFSDVRVSKGIKVKVIACGEGGELRGFDERKFLPAVPEKPTYILIYPGRTAYISLNAQGEMVGVVIENEGVSATQKLIFDALWKTLK